MVEQASDTGKVLKKLSLTNVVMAALFMAAIFIFALIVHETIFEKEDVFDSRVISFFAVYSSPAVISAMRFFTFFGSGLFLVPAYLALVAWYLYIRKRAYGINIALMGITSSLMVHALKLFFHRPRPGMSLIKQLKTYSFPSGHSVSSFIFCSILIYLLWQGNTRPAWKWIWSVLLLLFSFTIGVSRIVLGAHYPSDVAAGFCLGLIWVLVIFWFVEKKRVKKNQVI